MARYWLCGWILIALVLSTVGCGLLDDVDRSGLEDRRSSFTIKGTVKDESGSPLEGVKVSRSGAGYVFEPEFRRYKDIDKDHSDQDFTGYPILRFEIAGKVTDAGYNPVADVRITVEYGDTSYVITTNDYGFYRAEGLPGRQDYCLTPRRPACIFEPSQRCYEFLDQSHYDQDFIVTCE
jgi:hypothetical protein